MGPGTHSVTVFKEKHGQWFGSMRPRRESRGGNESVIPFFGVMKILDLRAINCQYGGKI